MHTVQSEVLVIVQWRRPATGERTCPV